MKPIFSLDITQLIAYRMLSQTAIDSSYDIRIPHEIDSPGSDFT
jgi:hypothetical protein